MRAMITHRDRLLSCLKMTRDWDAGAYKRVSDPQFAWGMKVLDSVELRGDEVAIDIGCGAGRLTAELLDRLPLGRVIAVDASPNMITIARAELEPRYRGRVELIESDGLKLAFDSVA